MPRTNVLPGTPSRKAASALSTISASSCGEVRTDNLKNGSVHLSGSGDRQHRQSHSSANDVRLRKLRLDLSCNLMK